ncbi:hypothetical protein ACFYVL_40220 [Streptomyces sp. NPDC004111]|uniref:hypothetical protein n=1 Tax=Streptomyces sp. NPDC004111 TaxID=3364690 RepID=UPI00367F44D3
MRGRLRRLVPARFDRGTLRAAGFVVLLVVVFTVVDTQVAAAADGNGGGGTGLLAPLNLTTSEGAPLEGYRLGSNPGIILNVADNLRAFLLSGGFSVVRILVGIAGWLVEFVFTFPLLSMLLRPAQELSDTYNRLVVDTLGLKGLLLGWAFVFGLILFARGKAARGLGEILLTLLIAAFAASALIRPDYLLAKDGPLDQVHQAAAEVAVATVNSYDFNTHGEAPCAGLPAAAVAPCEQREGAKADPNPGSIKAKDIAKPIQDVLTNALVVKPYMLVQYGRILDPVKDAKAYAVHLKWVNGKYDPKPGGGALQGEEKEKQEEACSALKGRAYDFCMAGPDGPSPAEIPGEDTNSPVDVLGYLSPESVEFNKFVDELSKTGPTGAAASEYAKDSSWERVGAVVLLVIAVVLIAAMVVAMTLVMLGTQAAEVGASAGGGVALVWGMLPGPSRSTVWKWLMIFMASTLLMFAVAAFIPFFGIAVDVVLTDGPDLLLERLLLIDAIAVLGLAFHRRLLASATGLAERLKTQMRFAKVGGTHLSGDSSEIGAALATYANSGGGVSSGMLLGGGGKGFRAGLLGTRQRLMSRLAALSDGTGMPVNAGGILRDAGAEARRGLAPGMIAATGGALAARGAYALLVGGRPGDDKLAKWRVATDPKLPPGQEKEDGPPVSGPHGTGPNGPQPPGSGKGGPGSGGPHAPVRINKDGEVLHDPATDRPLLGVRAHNRLVRFRGYRLARRTGLVAYGSTYGLPATVKRANQARSDLWADAKQQVSVTKGQWGEDGSEWEPVGRPLKAAGQAAGRAAHQAAVNTAVAGTILSSSTRSASTTGTSPTPVSRPAEGASYTRQRVNDALFKAQREDWEARRAEEGNGSAPLKANPRPEPVQVPDEVAPRSPQDGPCAKCGQVTRRYGVGGNPLCGSCRTAAPPLPQAQPAPEPKPERRPRQPQEPKGQPDNFNENDWTWTTYDGSGGA